MSISILKNAQKKHINLNYFPYIIIEDALDEDLYEQLSNEYPSSNDIINSEDEKSDKNNNKRCNMNSIYITNNNIVSETWKQFINYHTSNEFWLEILDLFKDEILKLHPNLEKQIGCKLEDISTHMRYSKDTNAKEIEMECQIAINTPVTRLSSVRKTHVDFADKLFVGLFYMRSDEDDSQGGDLEIYKVKDKDKTKYNKIGKYKSVKPHFVSKVDTIKYKKNCLVFFINCKHALHAVSPRHPTKHNRRFINFGGGLGSLHLF